MIFYFSGTGNSRWVAAQIASLTGDKAQDIADRALDCAGERQIGFVFPVYAWGVPEPVRAFVKTLGSTKAFTFAICTCGSEAGHALKKLGLALDSGYSLAMPNNYIIGADVDDEATIRRKLDAAREALQTIAGEILARKPVYRVEEGALAGLKSSVVHEGFERFACSTKPFYAEESCNGCGLCARDCPAGTITLKNGKPVWGKACYQCLRCINACPQRAIQYGKSTKNRGRYTLEMYVRPGEAQ